MYSNRRVCEIRMLDTVNIVSQKNRPQRPEILEEKLIRQKYGKTCI